MTQIARYGQMLKVPVRTAKIHVGMRNKTEGSVLRGLAQASCLGIETRLELESDQPSERVAALVRQAEAGCYTMQALLHPVAFTRSVILNGSPLVG